MTCSSLILRSSVVGSFALLTLLGCERDNAQSTEDERTGAAVGSAGTGTGMRSGTEAERTGMERTPGTTTTREEIERTSGRDETLGSGGTADRMGGAAGRGGSGGRGGAGGTTA